MPVEGIDLRGKTALVTGASGGIGRVFAQYLARAGAAVALTARSLPRLNETLDLIRGEGGKAVAVAFDVINQEAVNQGIRQAEETLGPIDLLVNNAGEGGPIDNAWDTNPAQWWHTFELNVLGPFLCAHAILPGMVSRRGGTIVNIASHAGVYRWPSCSAYSASKAALIKFSENLAMEAKEHNVSVFTLHPGLLAIGMTESLLALETQPDSPTGQVAEWFRRQIAGGRTVPPERGAGALLALASGRYSSLSGCYLTVDDDLDALAARMNDNQDGDLLMLRLRK